MLCQRKGWIEYRHKLQLFGQPPQNEQQVRTSDVGGAPQPADSSCRSPEDTDDEGPVSEEATGQPGLLKHGDVYYLQSPEAVSGLLKVERYALRWPLKPAVELHASSV